MKSIRIYQPGIYKPGDNLQLSDKAGQHVGVVLRKQRGDLLTLFNGDNHEYIATIQAIQKKRVSVTIESMQEINRESILKLNLAQAISKGDRMDLVIQKATELGVTSITPIIAERTVVRLDKARLEKKQAQWQAIATSACEQCGRNTLPIVHHPLAFADYLSQIQDDIRLLLDPLSTESLTKINLPEGKMTLLIGPEGGLSADELLEAQKYHFHGLKLGPRVLRTETAAITAISLLQAVCGDL